MSLDDTAPAAATDTAALREANARLTVQLGRIVRDLEERDDVHVRVDLDAPPGESIVVLRPVAAPPPPAPAAPATRGGLGDEATREVREVALRLDVVHRDLVRLQQNVEKLLWRAGDRPAPLGLDAADRAGRAGPGTYST